MQSSKVRKMQDYCLGDDVKDEGYYAGTVEAIMADPRDTTTAYMLVVTDNGDYTTYRGSMTVRCGLALARRVPAEVAQAFARVVLGGEPPGGLPVRRVRKFPVTQDVADQTERSVPASNKCSNAPYFDFV